MSPKAQTMKMQRIFVLSDIFELLCRFAKSLHLPSPLLTRFPARPLLLSLRGPYLVSLEIGLQRDPGQRWGPQQSGGGTPGLGVQGPQQGEAQPQETYRHGFRAEEAAGPGSS